MERDGLILIVDDDRFTFEPGEEAVMRSIRFRTLGCYAKARSGQLKNFTGIDSPYETPEIPEIHIDTTKMSIDEVAEQIVKQLLLGSGPINPLEVCGTA